MKIGLRSTIMIYALCLMFGKMHSLKLLELRVPRLIPLGSSPSLYCRWELGPTDVLYSVKWYKDGKEFYHHVPRDLQPSRKFLLPGVEVEKSDSTGSNVTLIPAMLDTEGRYRCEVSGEGPLFHTVSEHADMVVVVLPDRGPTISGFQNRYKTGDRVHVNCTSGRSKPATKLAWYINGEPATSTITKAPEVYRDKDGLETASSVLDFKVTEQNFQRNTLKVKCLATLGAIYWRSNEEIAREVRSKIYDATEVKYFATDKTDSARLVPSSAVHWCINFSKVLCLLICITFYYIFGIFNL